MENLFNEVVSQNTTTNTTNGTEEHSDFPTLHELEKEHVMRALKFANGSKAKAASLLGVSVKTIYNKLNSYKSSETVSNQGE